MKYKDGVIVLLVKMIDGKQVWISPSDKITFALKTADAISTSRFNKEIVITSLLDGKHGVKSLHYSGNGADLRIFIYTKDELAAFVKFLKEALDKEFDIVLEKDHIHIEYDPK